MATTYINLDAGHDRNGNPRRVFVVFDGEGYLVGTFNEGYAGDSEVQKVFPKAIDLGRFETTPKQYRALLKGPRRMR